MSKINEVLSRSNFTKNYKKLNSDNAVIALWSPGDYDYLKKEEPKKFSEYNEALNFFEKHIRLEFWDTENNVPNYPSINEAQAYILAQFIDNNRDKDFIIHCEAGQSRSAGVSMAVECIVNYNGDKYKYQTAFEPPFVSKYPGYSPNYFVYDQIVKMYNELKKPGGWVKQQPGIPEKFDPFPEEDPIGSNPFMTDFSAQE